MHLPSTLRRVISPRTSFSAPSLPRGTTLLAVMAALLGVNLLVVTLAGNAARDIGLAPAAAYAQPSTSRDTKITNDPPFNAAEQRRRMIEQLEQLSVRLAAIESKLDKGLSVKVTEMPPVKIASMPKSE